MQPWLFGLADCDAVADADADVRLEAIWKGGTRITRQTYANFLNRRQATASSKVEEINTHSHSHIPWHTLMLSAPSPYLPAM